MGHKHAKFDAILHNFRIDREYIVAAAEEATDLAAPTGVVVAIEWDCGRPLDGSLVASASSCWVAGFVARLPISFFVVGVVS